MHIVTPLDIKQLAEEIKIKVEDQFVVDTIADINVVIAQMQIIADLETDHVEPMYFPHQHIFSSLRADTSPFVLSHATVMQLAPEQDGDYILVPNHRQQAEDSN